MFKKFYIPGMISLVLLPILLLPKLNSILKDNDFRYIKLNIPDHKSIKKQHFNFSVEAIYRNTEIVDVGEVSSDTAKIHFLFEKLEKYSLDSSELKSKKPDFNYGFKFKLSPETSYKQIVYLLDNCLKKQFRRYAFDIQNDNFVVFQKKYESFDLEPHKMPFIVCGTYYLNRSIREKQENSILTKVKYLFHSKIINLILFGYIIFLTVSVLSYIIFRRKN
jgi:hypothetical protein